MRTVLKVDALKLTAPAVPSADSADIRRDPRFVDAKVRRMVKPAKEDLDGFMAKVREVKREVPLLEGSLYTTPHHTTHTTHTTHTHTRHHTPHTTLAYVHHIAATTAFMTA